MIAGQIILVYTKPQARTNIYLIFHFNLQAYNFIVGARSPPSILTFMEEITIRHKCTVIRRRYTHKNVSLDV